MATKATNLKDVVKDIEKLKSQSETVLKRLIVYARQSLPLRSLN